MSVTLMDNLIHRFNIREVAAAQEVGPLFVFNEKPVRYWRRKTSTIIKASSQSQDKESILGTIFCMMKIFKKWQQTGFMKIVTEKENLI